MHTLEYIWNGHRDILCVTDGNNNIHIYVNLNDLVTIQFSLVMQGKPKPLDIICHNFIATHQGWWYIIP